MEYRYTVFEIKDKTVYGDSGAMYFRTAFFRIDSIVDEVATFVYTSQHTFSGDTTNEQIDSWVTSYCDTFVSQIPSDV